MKIALNVDNIIMHVKHPSKYVLHIKFTHYRYGIISEKQRISPVTLKLSKMLLYDVTRKTAASTIDRAKHTV